MATPQSIRYLNLVRALNALFRDGGMSRADLARRLELNRASTGYIIEDLLEARLARERTDLGRDAGRSRAGRPGIVVELDPGGAAFVGAEIGVDHLTVVAVDLSGREIFHRSLEYPTSARQPETAIGRAAGLVGAAVASLDDRQRARIRGVCVAVPALVQHGDVVHALMLGWREVALRERFRAALALPVPVAVENDANALAIGLTYGVASEPSDTVVCLNLENGVGGAIVMGGELFRGATGFAGELGQLPLGGQGYCPGHRRPGHLESYVGKDAVLARYAFHGGPAGAGLTELLAALDTGDRAARRAASDWAERLAQGLTCVVQVVNPSRIVLGGSVAPLHARVAGRVRDAIRRELIEGFPLPTIEVSGLGARGTAFGAACLLHQDFFAVDERRVHAHGGDRPRSNNSKRRPGPPRPLRPSGGRRRAAGASASSQAGQPRSVVHRRTL